MKLVGSDHYLLHYEHVQVLLSFWIMYVCIHTPTPTHTAQSQRL